MGDEKPIKPIRKVRTPAEVRRHMAANPPETSVLAACTARPFDPALRFRCAECGKTVGEPVPVLRCSCGESYTGAPEELTGLRAAYLEQLARADAAESALRDAERELDAAERIGDEQRERAKKAEFLVEGYQRKLCSIRSRALAWSNGDAEAIDRLLQVATGPAEFDARDRQALCHLLLRAAVEFDR